MRYESADLIVVGGGMTGALTAWKAACQGRSVVLLDRSQPGSSRHELVGPLLRVSYSDPVRLRLAQWALQGWLELEQELGRALLTWDEHLELGPRTRMETLRRGLDAHSVPHEMLERSRWPGLTIEGEDLQGVLTRAALLDSQVAWEGIWLLAQRAGVRCFADTPIKFLDLEYDRLTAVGSDTAFRGQSMIVMAGLGTAALLPDLALLSHGQQWDRGKARLDVPHLLFHFAVTPVTLVGGERYRLSRKRAVRNAAIDSLETQKLHEFLDRWLPEAPPPEESVLFETQDSSDGNFLLGPHPMRDDLTVVAAVGDQGFALSPGLAQTALALSNRVDAGLALDSLALDRKVQTANSA